MAHAAVQVAGFVKVDQDFTRATVTIGADHLCRTQKVERVLLSHWISAHVTRVGRMV